MDIDNRKILIAVGAITLLLFPVAAFTTGPLRIALGLPFVLFFPGYALLSALFPRRNNLDSIERLALSFGLSIAIVPLIGLILNYTPWGIKLYPILISVSLFIIVTAAVAYYRQWKLPEADSLHFTFGIHLPRWSGMTKLNKTLSVSLIIAILVAIGCLGYVIATPKQGQEFTEFYILGLDGKAQGYPKEAIVGQPIYLIMGIVNQEHQTTSYRVEIKTNGDIIKQLTIGSLEHEQKWEGTISFTSRTPGEKQNFEFYLYKNDEASPCFKDPLHLYIDVYS
jgi:uncharacterized membrane protein